MKIFFLSSGAYLPSLRGGGILTTDSLAHRCVRAGHEPMVLAGLSTAKTWFALKSRALAKISPNGFMLDHVCGYPVYRGWNPVTFLKRVFQLERPDVAVIQGGDQNHLALAALAADVPVVYYLHDIEFNFADTNLPFQERMQFIANSKYTADIFHERTSRDCTIIPPLVEPEHYRNGAPGDAVLFVNPNPRKGLDVALTLAEQCPDIPFIFVENWGVSHEHEKLTATRTAHLRNIAWLKSTGNMKLLYARAKIVLTPSGAPYMGTPVNLVEAWGRVATEAHFSGIPVIASNQGGLPESVGPGGILVDPNAEMSAWKAALRGLWDDPQRYLELSAQARRYSQRPEIQPQKLFEDFISVCQMAVNGQPHDAK